MPGGAAEQDRFATCIVVSGTIAADVSGGTLKFDTNEDSTFASGTLAATTDEDTNQSDTDSTTTAVESTIDTESGKPGVGRLHDEQHGDGFGAGGRRRHQPSRHQRQLAPIDNGDGAGERQPVI